MLKAIMGATFVALGFALNLSASADSDEDGQAHFVGPGESLETIAEKYYENALAYPTIIEATNEKADGDSSFAKIEDPRLIYPGQKIWVPVLVTLLAKDMEGHGVHGAAPWGYQGQIGPTHWGDLDENYALCGSGREQSPISIPSDSATGSGDLQFAYKETGIHVLNNGHTIQVNYDPGSKLGIGGKNYELSQFHFHAPSEHSIDGVLAALEMHLVHVDVDGNMAVVGVLFDIAEDDNAFLDRFWTLVPKVGHELSTNKKFNIAVAFNSDAPKYMYKGSLTTPPCSENVNWYVVKERQALSKEQLARFVSVIGMNNRPVQPLLDREIRR